ncbi:MAG: hypothetical protein ABIQ18_31420 [Umezawaea sp.]
MRSRRSTTGGDVVVPPEFVEWRTRVAGEAGRDWVATLPGLVERLCAE